MTAERARNEARGEARSESVAAKPRRASGDAARTLEGDDVPGWAYPGLDYSSFRLSLVAKAIDRLTIKMLSDNCDLAIAEWRVLSRLAPIEGATVREISQMAWVDRAEVSRAATSLEARGLTSRRPNPSDGRSPVLFITTLGLKLYRKLLPIRAEFHHALTADFSEAEREALDNLLHRIALKVTRLTEDQPG